MCNLVESTERHSIGAMDIVGGEAASKARKVVAGFRVRDGTDSPKHKYAYRENGVQF